MSVLHDLLFDYTLRTVALGTAVLGIVSGALGSFAVLRRQSLLGDAISHAALPGLVLAFLVTGSKAPLVLVLGAAVAGWLGTLAVMAVVRSSRVPEDAALGIVLSVFFGVGLVLLTFVQRLPTASQAGLDRFLFGQAATLLARDVTLMAGLAAVALLVLVLFWKEFKLLSFDREYGASLGLRVRLLDVLLTTVLVLAIVLGLQTVGVVLMSAMVIAPAAAARQWTDSLAVMVWLAAGFGALAGVSGAVISATAASLPTGPLIVLAATVLVAISMTLAPRRGLLWAAVAKRRHSRSLRRETLLEDLYELARQHADPRHGHDAAVLEALRGKQAGVRQSLVALEAESLAARDEHGHWHITSIGRSRVEQHEGNGHAEH
jgi:manganese/zinc/iron transport system permease protein